MRTKSAAVVACIWSRRRLLAVLAVLSVLSSGQRAWAQEVPISFAGILNSGQTDTLGLFGPPGGDLSGKPFSVVLLYNASDLRLGENQRYTPTASGAIISSATINGITVTTTNTLYDNNPGGSGVSLMQGGTDDIAVAAYAWADQECTPFTTVNYYWSHDSITNPGMPVPDSLASLTLGTSCQFENLNATAGGLASVSPFLLGKSGKDLGDLNLETVLPTLTTPDSATALAADGTSAAIVLFQVPTNAPVTFTTNDGTSVLDYDPKFLTYAPLPGNSTVTVTPILIGSVYYAVALLQAPPAIVVPNYTTPITVTAQQDGGQVQQAYLPLVPPPVLLVHGLWGDLTSLSNLQAYLTTQAPWSSDPNLIQSICYSKFLEFDAKTDPLARGQECEWTSTVGLKTEIVPILGQYHGEGVVVGRVDAVVHSMGGLAARNYASQPFYRSLVDRMQGQFYTIVTLDTPEIGSNLATFLIDNRGRSRQRPGDAIWSAFCHLRSGPLEKCFEAQKMPIDVPGVPLKETAVYSLEPDSPSLTRKDLASPNITNAVWRAVSATAPDNSALEGLLNDLMTEITPENQNPPTVSGELGTSSHDAIVTTQSQIAGAGSGQISMFSGLSHSSTMLPRKLIKLNKWDDSSVVDDSTGAVNQTVACLLQSAGAVACAPRQPKIIQVSYDPETKSVGPQAEYTIKLQAPKHAVLGTPLEIAFRGVRSIALKAITVTQDEQSQLNKGCSQEASIDRVLGDQLYVRVTPCILGDSTISVETESADGSVGEGRIDILIQPPASPPASFKLSTFGKLFIDLSDNDPMVTIYPTAIFTGISGTYRIPNQFLTYDLAAGSPASVVSVGQHGLIRGLSEGKTIVEAHFGQATDRLEVVVQKR